jgi:uncharacterized protein (TIGR03435 family)
MLPVQACPSIHFYRDDHDKSFHRYQAMTFPHCIVVGPDGLIKAITLPDHVNSEVLEKIARQEPVNLPLKSGRLADNQWDYKPSDGDEPTYQVIVEPTFCQSAGAFLPPGGRRYSADGVTVESALQAAFHTNYTHVDCQIPDAMRNQQYRISVWVPDGQEATLGDTILDSIQRVAPVQASLQTKEREVYVVTRDSQIEIPRSTVSGAGVGFSRGRITGDGISLAMLVSSVENFARIPLVDETGIDFRFDIELQYDVADFSVLQNELKEKMGLKLTKARRPSPILCIRPKTEKL